MWTNATLYFNEYERKKNGEYRNASSNGISSSVDGTYLTATVLNTAI